MRLNELYPFPEERKSRKRVGRGAGSGLGGTSGKGHKGQNARAGGGVRPGFEGGQMPLQRRLPKRGFKNYLFKTTFEVVNVGRLLAAFPDKAEISLEDIYTSGLIRGDGAVKVLGAGDVDRAVSVEAFCFSQSARDKILAAGGKVKELLAEEEEPAATEE